MSSQEDSKPKQYVNGSYQEILDAIKTEKRTHVPVSFHLLNQTSEAFQKSLAICTYHN